jgi:hypothetical protein
MRIGSPICVLGKDFVKLAQKDTEEAVERLKGLTIKDVKRVILLLSDRVVRVKMQNSSRAAKDREGPRACQRTRAGVAPPVCACCYVPRGILKFTWLSFCVPRS